MSKPLREGMINSINQKAGNTVEKKCYSVDDLQIILCVSRPTVYRLIRRNEFHSFQIGKGKWRISKKSFDDWLDNVGL